MTVKAEVAQQEPLSTARELQLLSDMRSLARDCSRTKTRLRAALADGLAQAKNSWEGAVKTTDNNTRDGRLAAAAKHEQTTVAIRQQYELDRDAAQHQYVGLRRSVELEHMRVTESARQQHKRQSWEAHTVYDGRRAQAQERFVEASKAIQRSSEELSLLENEAVEIMKMRRQWREFPPLGEHQPADPSENHKAPRVILGRSASGGHSPTDESESFQEFASPDNVEGNLQRISTLSESVREAAQALHDQRLERMYEGEYVFSAFVVIWLIAALACGFSLEWDSWHWVAASVVAAVVGTVVLLAALWPFARRQSGAQYQHVQRLTGQTRRSMQNLLEAAQERGRREARDLLLERDQQVATIEQQLQATLLEKDRWKESELDQAAERFPARLAQLREDMNLSLATAAKNFNQSLADLTTEHDRQLQEHRRRYEERCQEIRTQHDQDWQALTQRWQQGLTLFQLALADLTAQCAELFPDWDTTEYDQWPHPDVPSAAVQFGKITDHLAIAEDQLPASDDESHVQISLDLPALMAIDEHPVMAITADEEGRRAAVDLMQLRHAAVSDGNAAGQSAVYDPRPGRTRRKLCLVHAPGRFRRAA